MKYQKTILLTLLLMLLCLKGTTQDFVYKIGYFGFFDNREYFNEFVHDQTIFGTRIYGELGYAFDDHNRIMVGTNYMYEFGSKGEWIAPDFTAYYYGQHNKLGFYLGAFPRVDKIAMPKALLDDTIPYYRPNIEGLLIEYHTKGFQQNVWMDWVGRQSYEKQEIFHIGFSGFLHKGLLLYQHHFIMTHLAHSLNQQIEEHIQDNAGFMILPGINLSQMTKLDSLTISAGVLASYDRLRGIYSFNFPVGFYGEINALYRRIGFKGVIYTGDSQTITSGDGFYKSTFYCRTDAFYQLSNSFVDAKLQWSFHFIPHVVDVSMSLVLRAELDGLFRRHHQSN
jgi:hypothetical protein